MRLEEAVYRKAPRVSTVSSLSLLVNGLCEDVSAFALDNTSTGTKIPSQTRC